MKTDERKISIEYVDIESLHLWPRNPKLHDADGISEAIDEFGYVDPIIVDETTKRIVSGHGRIAELRRRRDNSEVPPNGITVDEGVWLAPVVRGVAFEDEDQAERYVLAANRLVETGGYDESKLAALLVQHESESGLRGTGYSESDVEDLLERLHNERGGIGASSEYGEASPFERAGVEPEIRLAATRTPETPAPGLTDPDETPEVAEAPVSRLGDLWLLGDHRLLCGDSTKPETFSTVLGDGLLAVSLVFTDPPYNEAGGMSKNNYQGLPGNMGRALRELANAPWDVSFDMGAFLLALESVSLNDVTIYVCTSRILFGQIMAWMRARTNINGDIAWCKPNPMPCMSKRHYTWSTEHIIFGTIGKHTFNFPSEGHALNYWVINKNQKNDLHPTQKPVAVPLRALEYSSNRGDLVLDAFTGSGTTLIACEQLGRRFAGIELDPKYIDTTIKRWQLFTGKQATLDGKSFDEVALERKSDR